MSEGKRSSNWGGMETITLLSEIILGQEILFSKLCDATTLAQKNRIWLSIVEKVNNTAGQNRDVRSCKKRWKDLKSLYLHRHKSRPNRTGGGKPTPTTPYHELIVQILGEKTSLDRAITDVADSLPDRMIAPWAVTIEGEVTLEGNDDNESEISRTEFSDAPTPSTSSSNHALATPTLTSGLFASSNQALATPTLTPSLCASSIQASTPTPPSHAQQAEAERPVPGHTPAQPTKKRKLRSFTPVMAEEESALTVEWLKSAIEKNKAKQALCESLKVKTDLEIALLRKNAAK